MNVHLLVRKDFDWLAIQFAKQAIIYHLDNDVEPNENVSSQPRTTFQTGIVNIPSTLIGLEVSIGFWARRNLSQYVANRLQALPTVSHVSFLQNAAPLVLNPDAKIEGLDISKDDYLHKFIVTTHFDAHKGYVKSYQKWQKEGKFTETELSEKLAAEADRFASLQANGHISSNLNCRC